MNRKRKHPTIVNDLLLIGRSEWCELPQLNTPAIKAKIDTGAKTSSIHAFNIKAKQYKSKKIVYFDIHPIQGNEKTIVSARAEVVDERDVMSSNGHKEHRYVIMTHLVLGGQTWDIEVTLSNRDPLRYRLLLGREALSGKVLVHPGLSCAYGKKSKLQVMKSYTP